MKWIDLGFVKDDVLDLFEAAQKAALAKADELMEDLLATLGPESLETYDVKFEVTFVHYDGDLEVFLNNIKKAMPLNLPYVNQSTYTKDVLEIEVDFDGWTVKPGESVVVLEGTIYDVVKTASIPARFPRTK